MTQTSMVMTRIGGVDYPVRSEPNCKTCQSPHRFRIEADLIKGLSYTVIARSLQGLPEGPKGHPTAEGIANHVKAVHLPVGAATQRRIIERRAQEIGRNIEHDTEVLADHVTVSQMIVQRGVEMVAEGNLEIKGSDVLAAARFLHQVEQAAGGETDTQVWIDVVMEHMALVQKWLPPEAWAGYTHDLNNSPVLKQLAAKQRTIAGEVAEAG